MNEGYTAQAEKYPLTASQKEILSSELASPGSAINTISVKLHLPSASPADVKRAANEAMRGADVFSAALVCDGGDGYFLRGGCTAEPCRVTAEMTRRQVMEYFTDCDAQPLGFADRLYRAEVIPSAEGGAYLYVRFHHILTDGWGMCVFAQRVLDALSGRTPGASVFFGTGDVAAKTDTSFWTDTFGDAEYEPSVLQSNATGYKKSTFCSVIASSLYSRIKKYAGAVGVTVPYVLLAAYALYLAAATDRDEAVVLMPRLNRERSELSTVGCFTMLVPVRIRVDINETFAELVRKAARCAKEASEHKQPGYSAIQAAINGESGASGALSEYVFNYYKYRLDSEIPHTLDISVAGEMRNHLTLNVFQRTTDLLCSTDCRAGVYDEKRGSYFIDSIKTIIGCGINDPKICDIPILGAEERRELSGIRGKRIKLSPDATIPSLFRQAAKKYPRRPALYAGEDTLDFASLDRMTDRIASALVSRGVKCGDRVAFMLPRDIRLIPVMIGISKSGATFIPVDPAYPQDRIDYILHDSGASYIISDASVAPSGVDCIEADSLISSDATAQLPQVEQAQTAYMIYTSGTTGKPKGVMLSHRGIVNIVHPDNNPFNRDAVRNGRGIVAIGSICFDISLFEIFVPLMNGLFVELGCEKAMLDASQTARLIKRHGANLLHCTPSRLVSYLDNASFREALSDVEAVLSAGEVLPEGLVFELKNRYNIRIYNGYGPTETTIGATITRDGDSKTIGTPIANTGILILDRHGRRLPSGATGEICVYGDGVGMGYRGREEETRAKFTEHEGVRIYRTGDLGHLNEHGELIYHGRNDRQIKLRGLRIEPGEIERVMNEFPGIRQAVCTVRRINNSEHLVAFFTADGDTDTDALRSHMSKKLTPYMVPEVLRRMDAMPQTPGGKTDVKALLNEPVELIRKYRAPHDRTQRMLCLAFASALGAECVGLDDNFFELGGNSLKSVGLMLEIEELLALEPGVLEYTDIYRYPTPAQLADKLSGTSGGEELYDIKSLDYTGIDKYLSSPRAERREGGGLGNVLLTGATGYLGIHILIDLLRRDNICGKIYCLVRSNSRLSAEKRLKSALFYYAEEDFAQSCGERWQVVEGDVSTPEIFTHDFDGQIDTVINSAANVAHFAYGDALTRSNVDGVRNLIALAQAKKAAFCQISTISVGGVYKGEGEEKSFTERDLYIGQEIHNQYIYTKYMAEYLLLRAAVDSGLDGRLFRVGNLQGRSADGEFQINMKSNAFTRQLSSYIKMNAVPASVYNSSVNFSPVDDTAHLIVSLAAYAKEGRAFHVYPPEQVEYRRIFDVLSTLGRKVRVMEDAEFNALLERLKRSRDEAELAEGLLTERPDTDFRYYPVSQDETERSLASIGGGWTEITDEYLVKYLASLRDMDMF